MTGWIGWVGTLIVGGIPGSDAGGGTKIGVGFQEGAGGGAGVVRGILTLGNNTGRNGGFWAVAPPPDTVIIVITIANPIANQRFERIDISIRE